jgi:hypothetical protein
MADSEMDRADRMLAIQLLAQLPDEQRRVSRILALVGSLAASVLFADQDAAERSSGESSGCNLVHISRGTSRVAPL